VRLVALRVELDGCAAGNSDYSRGSTMVSQIKRVKRATITVYCSPDEHAALQRAADHERQPLSQWARNLMLLRYEHVRRRMNERRPISEHPPAPAKEA
jgi:hypothetical protein